MSLGVLPEFWGPQTECPAVPDNGRGEINRDPGPDKEERNEFSPCERLTEEEDPERRDKNRVQVLNEPENQHREARSGVGEGDHRDCGHKADKEKREIELHTVPMKEVHPAGALEIHEVKRGGNKHQSVLDREADPGGKRHFLLDRGVDSPGARNQNRDPRNSAEAPDHDENPNEREEHGNPLNGCQFLAEKHDAESDRHKRREEHPDPKLHHVPGVHSHDIHEPVRA